MANVVVRVKLKGADKIFKALENAPKEIQNEGNVAIRKIMRNIEATTVPLVPVAKPWTWKRPVKGYVGGFLRINRIIQYRNLAAVFIFRAPYAGWVHDGTEHMKARPFLRQGVDKAQSTIDKLWKDMGDKVLNNIARR